METILKENFNLSSSDSGPIGLSPLNNRKKKLAEVGNIYVFPEVMLEISFFNIQW